MSEGFYLARVSRSSPAERHERTTSRRDNIWSAAFPCSRRGRRRIRLWRHWDFSIVGEVDQPKRWSWDEFHALPRETVTKDIHCVTKWSKLDTHWEGVSLDTLLAQVETSASYVIAFCDGGYTTNLPLDEVLGGQAWVVDTYEGQPLAPATRRPGTLAGAPPLLLEERQVGAGPAPGRSG